MLPIIRYRKIWFVFSGVLITASIIALALWQLRLGIDFTGGSLLEFKRTDSTNVFIDYSAIIDPLLEHDFVVQPTDRESIILRTEAINEETHQKIIGVLRAAAGEIVEIRFDSIGPVIGQELARKSIWALVVVFVAIVLYIAWSFRKVSRPVSSWKYGLITIFTGLHDIIIPLGLFSAFGQFYGTEVTAAFVAAVLTILGYSINDTIVVLDRVRENLSQGTNDFEATVNTSVNQTMARSINTTLTTLLALIAVYLFGGVTVKDFALALIVGIATGAYSSIFIASPFLVVWQRATRT